MMAQTAGRDPGAEPVSTGSRKQPAFEKRLHVPATISDQEDDDARVDYPVDQAKLSEQNLPKLLDTQPFQFPGYGASLRKGFQGFDDREEFADQGVGIVDAANLQAISVNFFKIILATLRQLDAVSPPGHPRAFARSRTATSRAARVRPASMSC